jgi:diacylglycerol kinase
VSVAGAGAGSPAVLFTLQLLVITWSLVLYDYFLSGNDGTT